MANTMDKRIARTLRNPRWWIVLPLFPVAFVGALVHWTLRRTVDVLDDIEGFSGRIFNWMREGK